MSDKLLGTVNDSMKKQNRNIVFSNVDGIVVFNDGAELTSRPAYRQASAQLIGNGGKIKRAVIAEILLVAIAISDSGDPSMSGIIKGIDCPGPVGKLYRVYRFCQGVKGAWFSLINGPTFWEAVLPAIGPVNGNIPIAGFGVLLGETDGPSQSHAHGLLMVVAIIT